MKKHLSIAFVATLAAGIAWIASAAYAQDAAQPAANQANDATKKAADDLNRPANRYVPGQLPPGIQKSQKDDSEDIRQSLANTAEAVVTKNDFGGLVDNFVDADRNRLGEFFKKTKDDAYNGRIAQIQKDWQAKYGQKFDMDHKIVFGPDFQGFMIVQGEIINPALLSNWPVPNQASQAKGGAALDSTDRPGNRPGDRNLDKGRNVAVVTFPASHGMPELNISMIHELPDHWRIDVPDNITPQQLHDQLLSHLTMVGEMKDRWPADVNEAYRLVSHHVLAAIYDISAQPSVGFDQNRLGNAPKAGEVQR